MKFRDLFEQWNLTGLKINAHFLEMEWAPKDSDKDAAWEIYVELMTRVTTQALPEGKGTEVAALASVHSLFSTTRNVLKSHGRDCVDFSKVAVVILNQVVRPFTSKWHKPIASGKMTKSQRKEFRAELTKLQKRLVSYTHLVAQIAGVEDITDIEQG